MAQRRYSEAHDRRKDADDLSGHIHVALDDESREQHDPPAGDADVPAKDGGHMGLIEMLDYAEECAEMRETFEIDEVEVKIVIKALKQYRAYLKGQKRVIP